MNEAGETVIACISQRLMAEDTAVQKAAKHE